MEGPPPAGGPLPGDGLPPPPGNARPPAGTPPKKPRTLLLGVGAVVALLIGVGAPTVDAYIYYKGGRPDETPHVVERGQALTFGHVSWKAAVEPMEAPKDSNPAPDRQWLKITVTRAAVDDDGAVMTAQPQLSMHDKQGRSWQTSIMESNVPTDKNPVGKPFTYTFASLVPKNVSDEVELHLEFSTTYRQDTPTEKLLEITPELEAAAKRKDVLVFRR